LVGLDGAGGSGAVLEFAFRQASLRHLPLTVQHSSWGRQASGAGADPSVARSTEVEERRSLAAEEMAGLGEAFPGVEVKHAAARGHPADCLVDEASRMDLLVVGRRQVGALSRITLGSIVTRVVQHAACPVAVVPY